MRLIIWLGLSFMFSGVSFAGEPIAYRWTDDTGSVHITNRLDSAPDAYRESVSPMKLEYVTSLDNALSLGPGLVEGDGMVSFDKGGGQVVAQVVINESVARNAIVDTGSGWVVITPKLARALGLDVKKARLGRFRAFEKVSLAPVVIIEVLRIGGATAKNVQAAVIDFQGRGPVSAIIGMNFLSRFLFEIDHSRGEITFTRLD